MEDVKTGTHKCKHVISSRFTTQFIYSSRHKVEMETLGVDARLLVFYIGCFFALFLDVLARSKCIHK